MKFSAPSLCRIRNRSSPPTTACSTEYSTQLAARQHRRELGLRVGGVAVAHLRGDRAARRDDDVLVAAGAADGDPEPLVGFVVDLLARQPGAEPVAPHGVGAPGVVDGDVVDGAVVGRPGGAGADADDLVVVQLAGA